MGSESEFYERRDGKRKRHQKERKDAKIKKDCICRDFLRNICDRGTSCKFEHPPDQRTMFSFCHDFQRSFCRRNKNCKFIHGSFEDEKHYMKTGELPQHLLDSYLKSQKNVSDDPDIQCCNKFLAGECWVEDCGYKHVALNEIHNLEEQPQPISHNENPHQRQVLPYCKPFMRDNCWDDSRKLEGRSPTPSENRHSYEPEIKRSYIVKNDDLSINGYDNSMPYQTRPQPERNYIMLEEENMMLRERITELKKRIDDLQVTNEFLLEQNARMKLQQDKNTARLTAMTVPAVTITNSVPGGNQITQNPTPQQMVTAALRTVTASVATVPVSIGTVTPVSLAAVSMAPVQQIPGSVMTIAQQGAHSAETQIAPQALPMTMSAPTVPLVSYSLMSRHVMQQPTPPSLRH